MPEFKPVPNDTHFQTLSGDIHKALLLYEREHGTFSTDLIKLAPYLATAILLLYTVNRTQPEPDPEPTLDELMTKLETLSRED